MSKKFQMFSYSFYLSFRLTIPIHVKDDEEMLTKFETALLGDVGFGRC